MDDYLHSMLRRALGRGLSFRMRLDEEGREPTLYLRLNETAGETTWAVAIPHDGGIEAALLNLFGACVQKIVEIGEREADDAVPRAGRPLPLGGGVPGEP